MFPPSCPEHHPLPPQATSTGRTRALTSSRSPDSMALSAMWSSPRVWTSPGPSLSTQRRGKELDRLANPISSSGLARSPWPTLSRPSFLHVLGADPTSTSSPRYLFWTEWGQYPRIERSRLDGTERVVLVNVSISWPNGISVDYQVGMQAWPWRQRVGPCALVGKLPLPYALLPFGTPYKGPHLAGRYGPRESWGLLAPLPPRVGLLPHPQKWWMGGHSEVGTGGKPRGQKIGRSESRRRWKKEEKETLPAARDKGPDRSPGPWR